MCVWTDGYMNNIAVKNVGQLKVMMQTLFQSYNSNHHLYHLQKLSEFKRDALNIEIKQKALAWSIASSSVNEIDSLNILQASLLAMKRAIELLVISFNQRVIAEKNIILVQVDGN